MKHPAEKRLLWDVFICLSCIKSLINLQDKCHLKLFVVKGTKSKRQTTIILQIGAS